MRSLGRSGFTLRDVLHKLRSEGWHAEPHHVWYAMERGAITPPKKRGGWNCYTSHHVDGLRKFLRERSRSQPKGGAK